MNGRKEEKKRKQVGEHHDGSFAVYMSHKIQKLRTQNAYMTSTKRTGSCVHNNNILQHLFAGIHIYVDGYTVPSKEELRQLILTYGGGFEHYETSRVTHIIATHLPLSKLLQLK